MRSILDGSNIRQPDLATKQLCRRAHGADPAKPHLARDHLLSLLRQMVWIRRFEEKCAELYQQEKIRSFLHLYIGEETVAVGAMQALTPAVRSSSPIAKTAMRSCVACRWTP
jgi:TPP-dependent pyruvate/acetoin dehydrogenase alpha subunit